MVAPMYDIGNVTRNGMHQEVIGCLQPLLGFMELALPGLLRESHNSSHVMSFVWSDVSSPTRFSGTQVTKRAGNQTTEHCICGAHRCNQNNMLAF